MNDQQPIGTGSTLDSRLRRHLEASADVIELPSRRSSEVRRIARQRSIRRRRVVSGTVAAATVTTLVVGVQQLASTGGERIRTASPTAVDPEPAPAASTSGARVALTPARATEPTFVWKVVEPAQQESISATFSGEQILTFPTLALSTAPGRSNDYDDIQPVVWRTDDGIAWERTGLESPFGRQTFWSVLSGSSLFAVGTAPGASPTAPSPVQVAVAGLDAVDWTTVELPVDTADRAALPFTVTSIDGAAYPLPDGSALVAVTPTSNLDLATLADANDDVDLDRVSTIDRDGLTVLGSSCASDRVMVSIEGGFAPRGTVVDDDPDATASDEECTPVLLTWAELGVSDDAVAAIAQPVTSLFHVSGDGTVTPVESPAPGKRLSALLGSAIPVFTTVDGFGQYDSEASFRYDGGAWIDGPLPATNWASTPVRLGDATVGWGWQEHSSQPYFARIGDDGSAVYSDVSALFDRHSLLSTSIGATAGGHVVTPVEVTRDRVAEAGGVELAKGAVIVRQDSLATNHYFVDAATGERIDESRIEWGDDHAVITDGAGGELARFTWSEIDGLTSAYAPGRSDRRWEIATTADGASFSVESVAELLGVDESRVDRVSRVSSNGSQVVVIVTLTDRYPDESRKQLALVGTPLG